MHIRSCPPLCCPWTVARQAPLSMEFFRQEYQSRLSFPPPEDLPDPGIKPGSLRSLARADRFFMKPKKSQNTSGTTCMWSCPSVPGACWAKGQSQFSHWAGKGPRFPPLPSGVRCPDVGVGKGGPILLMRGYIATNVSFLESVQQHIIFIKEKKTLIQ